MSQATATWTVPREIAGRVIIFHDPVRVLTCPTKHDWRDRSDLTLIRRSCEQLVAICDKFGVRTCYLPRPGCANGGLDWETQVRPVVEPILDDRFVVVDLPR